MKKSDIQSILGAKTVSFNSLYAKATGSVTAAVFLSQAVFWQEKSKFKTAIETIDIDGESYFSKTAAEWYDETGLSVEQQKTARKPLVLSGILKEKRAGLPAKMYFRIDIEALVSGISVYLNDGATVSGFSANRNTETPRTLAGKFRKQEHGNSISNYIGRELIESNESIKESSAAAPLSGPFQKVGEIKMPETISLENPKKEKTSPGAGGDVTPGRSTGGAVRLSIVDPELPGVRIEEEIQPKTDPEKTGRSKAKNPRSGTSDEIDLAMRVIEHLNQSAGRSFRVNAGENAKGIIARHREGFTEAQMQKVIDLKIRQWGNDAHMRGNINPVTLFRPTNFERYLVEAELPPMQQSATRSSIQTFTGSNYTEKQAF